MMSCPKCKHAAVSVYTRVSLYRDRKKRSERMGTILNKSCMRMTIGRIRWEMSLIWSDNWKRRQVSNIRPDGMIFLKETGDKHWTTNCLHVKTCVSDLFNHWFHFIEIGKKDTRVWAWFWWSHACVWQLEEFEERCHWFDRSNGSVDSDQIFASMV